MTPPSRDWSNRKKILIILKRRSKVLFPDLENTSYNSMSKRNRMNPLWLKNQSQPTNSHNNNKEGVYQTSINVQINIQEWQLIQNYISSSCFCPSRQIEYTFTFPSRALRFWHWQNPFPCILPVGFSQCDFLLLWRQHKNMIEERIDRTLNRVWGNLLWSMCQEMCNMLCNNYSHPLYSQEPASRRSGRCLHIRVERAI